VVIVRMLVILLSFIDRQIISMAIETNEGRS